VPDRITAVLVNDVLMSSRAEHRRQLGPFSVSPVGYGAMRLTGPNVFGPPKDRREAIALLREAVERGVDHIDTAQYYGPDVVNELIREALSPYPSDLVIVSKVGAARDASAGIYAADSPAELRRGIADNLRTLGIDTLPVVNLRLMRTFGPDTYFEDQLAALMWARDEGLITSIGLSNVTLEHLLHALRATDIACVQNAFHLLNRSSQSVLDECVRRGIAFVPFAPLGSGGSAPGSVLAAPAVVRIADRLGCTPAQVALAWTLNVAPNVVLIPGSASREHLRDNLAAVDLHLDRESVEELAGLRPGAPNL
jgi:aryl-alcohol dehydrogenase-like predicted oxidoreductase